MSTATAKQPTLAYQSRQNDVADMRRRFGKFIDSGHPSPSSRQWRVSVFDRGLLIADELESICGPLAGKRVLDVGAAYGGDLAAICARGAAGVGLDQTDHDYAGLKQHLGLGDRLDLLVADGSCSWPFRDGAFDVVVSLALVEFIEDLRGFFAELSRVLRPGGYAIVDSPSALRGVLCDPHYKLPVTSLLPIPLRRFVAQRICGREYRFRIRHTFYAAQTFRRLASPSGLEVSPRKFRTSSLLAGLKKRPGGNIWSAVLRELVYDYILLHKPL